MASAHPHSSQTAGPGSRSRLIAWLTVLLLVSVFGAVLWVGWPWLVAAGYVPLLIAALPCILMCGVMCATNLCLRPGHTNQKHNADSQATRSESPMSEPGTKA